MLIAVDVGTMSAFFRRHRSTVYRVPTTSSLRAFSSTPPVSGRFDRRLTNRWQANTGWLLSFLRQLRRIIGILTMKWPLRDSFRFPVARADLSVLAVALARALTERPRYTPPVYGGLTVSTSKSDEWSGWLRLLVFATAPSRLYTQVQLWNADTASI